MVPVSSAKGFASITSLNPQKTKGHTAVTFSTFSTFLVAQRIRIRLPMQGTRVRSNPWSGKISHAPEQLSPRSPQLLRPGHPEPVLPNRRSHHGKKPVYPRKTSRCSLQLEKVRKARNIPQSQKYINNEQTNHIINTKKKKSRLVTGLWFYFRHSYNKTRPPSPVVYLFQLLDL